ncbi:MAG TPA: hypothetical protein VG708_07205 [Mycobacteriales bacterium]|jgi:hypothetical protein|nr:hypothetical protein [Mycobacteriales bacterium]
MTRSASDEIRTYYVSRVIDLPAPAARLAFRALPEVALAQSHGSWSLCGTPSTLRPSTRSPLDPWPAPSRWQANDTHLGLLTLRHGSRSMKATLELAPWSTSRSELGLRPIRWGPTPWPPDNLLRTAHELLATLARRMVAKQVRSGTA